MGFHAKLTDAWTRTDSMLCVGLDPDPARLPGSLSGSSDAVFRFCAEIADATADLVCAFKPQVAYFAAIGAEAQLERLCEHIRTRHPDVVLILDAKRGDIGPTAERYAQEAFVRYGADAVTVNPYLGSDSLEPFFAHPGKGAIVLCRTSNPGSADFQSLETSDGPLYTHVARRAANEWAQRGEVALVVGATYPEELAVVRSIVGDMPLLVPGIGAQGGEVEATVRSGRNSTGYGMMVNASRSIIYAAATERDGNASWETNFASIARRAATELRDHIRSVT